MPRAYRLGERAAAIDATRTRILEAAIELFSDRGISATTSREIGERADVAPGTLRKHFPTRDALETAMVERLEAEAPLPALSILDGADTVEGRLRCLFRAAGTFFEQAERLYRMWLREPMLSGPWLTAGARYGERWEALMRLALGPLERDETAMSVLRAVLDPRFFQDLAKDGQSTAQAADLVADVVSQWFVARAAMKPGVAGVTLRPPRAPRPRGARGGAG